MKQSINKKLTKDKYYTSQKGKKENGFFFLLPSVFISPKKIADWETEMFSIFLGWGKYFIQYNIFKVIQNSNTDINREVVTKIFSVLKKEGLQLNQEQYTMKDLLAFLEENRYIIKIINNANIEHHYIKAIIINLFQNQPFINRK